MSEKQKSVLIIENNDVILSNLSARFKKRDMLVITAKDGYEGYTRACKELPSYIVCETLLPNMDGYRISRLLKFDDRFKEIPIILMTGNNPDTVKKIFQASGADELIHKPFRFRDLASIIEKMESV